jgi:hypothetical protein
MNSGEARLGPVVWKFLALIAFILAATWGVHELREALNLTIMPENEQQVHRAIMLGSFVFVVLLAFPFVPGAEIGVALLAAFGAAIAPLVYAGTVLAMMLAYAVGRVLPMEALVRLLRVLRMRRAADLVGRAAPLSGEERIAMMMEGAPSRIVALGVRNRYLAMALAVNTPGNSLIGGGGGIMMMAGLSGIFAPLPTFLTIAIAVSPVPLAVMFLGLTL